VDDPEVVCDEDGLAKLPDDVWLFVMTWGEPEGCSTAKIVTF
jgi:hypothetical protein